jgi:hypothetical protein
MEHLSLCANLVQQGRKKPFSERSHQFGAAIRTNFVQSISQILPGGGHRGGRAFYAQFNMATVLRVIHAR